MFKQMSLKSYNCIVSMNYGIEICNCGLIQYSSQNDILKEVIKEKCLHHKQES